MSFKKINILVFLAANAFAYNSVCSMDWTSFDSDDEYEQPLKSYEEVIPSAAYYIIHNYNGSPCLRHKKHWDYKISECSCKHDDNLQASIKFLQVHDMRVIEFFDVNGRLIESQNVLAAIEGISEDIIAEMLAPKIDPQVRLKALKAKIVLDNYDNPVILVFDRDSEAIHLGGYDRSAQLSDENLDFLSRYVDVRDLREIIDETNRPLVDDQIQPRSFLEQVTSYLGSFLVGEKQKQD